MFICSYKSSFCSHKDSVCPPNTAERFVCKAEVSSLAQRGIYKVAEILVSSRKQCILSLSLVVKDHNFGLNQGAHTLWFYFLNKTI